ncbi:hypothetical protein [Paludisphaera borealis]|uniref:Uncharacterized protein n=1 Tax=Paludisphaera borealis TaxID=1387353 RepID=A0A1U7CWC3_9BACT|nr:hypothetical protein [Paludisphaera borealis]APW63247.1 hypothetical protein BSF38_04811 [Paludisphaera borealis]MDR3619224.1 hypothetical protein [Paludisphaera borealis]
MPTQTPTIIPTQQRRAVGSRRATFGFALARDEMPMLDLLLASLPPRTTVSAAIRTLLYAEVARLEAAATLAD